MFLISWFFGLRQPKPPQPIVSMPTEILVNGIDAEILASGIDAESAAAGMTVTIEVN